MGLSNNGRDYVAETVGGRNFGRTQAAAAAISYTATQMADTGAAFSASSGTPGTPGSGSGLVGRVIVVAGSGANSAPVAYGTIRDNTTTAVNVDFWHTITAPETVATTPTGGGAGSGYAILPAGPPSFWMGISVATRAFNAADAFLSNDGSTISELFAVAQAGLSRQIAAYAHTSGTATYTIQKTFTVTAGDSGLLPAAVNKVGIFAHGLTATPTTTNSGVLLFNTNLSASATLTTTGDNVQITDTVTIS